MFGIGWQELFLVAIVALVVLGPKDIPRVMHTGGQWARKLRSMAAGLRSTFDQAMHEADMEEMRRQIQELKDWKPSVPPPPPDHIP
ncbi:MAG: Sec-independent protein translocase protein TatB [Pseudomonadota bacterium]|nr:Sec-independent protein translocase protein TatB [Pseudomonadota bacterium]